MCSISIVNLKCVVFLKHKLDKSCLFKINLFAFVFTYMCYWVSSQYLLTSWSFFPKKMQEARLLWITLSQFLILTVELTDSSLYLTLQSRKTKAGDNADLTGQLLTSSGTEIETRSSSAPVLCFVLHVTVSCAKGNDTSSSWFVIVHMHAHTHKHTCTVARKQSLE